MSTQGVPRPPLTDASGIRALQPFCPGFVIGNHLVARCGATSDFYIATIWLRNVPVGQTRHVQPMSCLTSFAFAPICNLKVARRLAQRYSFATSRLLNAFD